MDRLLLPRARRPPPDLSPIAALLLVHLDRITNCNRKSRMEVILERPVRERKEEIGKSLV